MLCQPGSFRLQLSWSKDEGIMQPFWHSFFSCPEFGGDTNLPVTSGPTLCSSQDSGCLGVTLDVVDPGLISHLDALFFFETLL